MSFYTDDMCRGSLIVGRGSLIIDRGPIRFVGRFVGRDDIAECKTTTLNNIHSCTGDTK